MRSVKVSNNYLPISLLIFLPLALHGCFDSSNVLAQRDLTAPAAVLVGEQIAWSVVAAPGEELRATVFDAKNKVVFHSAFDKVSNFTWTPFQPGIHLIDVRIRREDGVREIASGTVDVMPRGTPLVTGTDHPLVALYTYVIPGGLEGQVVYTCETCPDAVKSRTFATLLMKGSGAEVGTLLPALRPESSYSVQHDIFDGTELVSRGPILNHTTGPIPILVQDITLLIPPTSPRLNALLTVTPVLSITKVPPIPQMIDETAQTVWYHGRGGALTRPTGNGWAMLATGNAGAASALEIIDYTGQALRRATQKAVADQLAPLGLSDVGQFHHEMRPLPKGRYATLMYIEKTVTDIQGPGAVNVISDVIVVLDDQMRVMWAWNAFDHLDLTRQAILGDTSLGGGSNDWTHSNGIDYDPKDGNLILSIRHQSWVVKIAYENGRGDGHIVWRFGRDGDFTRTDGNPDLWFSYQHDSNILADGRLALYDNGNERFAVDTNATSRGQVYILDEQAMTAELDFNIELEFYNRFLGSAALNPDGSMHFNSGAVGIHEDIARDGRSHGAFQTPAFVYRSFRMMDPFDLSPN